MIKANNCEMCGKEEFDGCWLRKNGTKKFHYICYNCIAAVGPIRLASGQLQMSGTPVEVKA